MKLKITEREYFVIYRDGDYEFSVMCAAQGKPKPSVRWMKGGHDITNKLFATLISESESKFFLKF